MYGDTIERAWRAALAAVLAVGIVGCTTHYRDGPPYYTAAYHHYPYHYYYYPGTRVYFHISSGYYYYRDGDHWKRVRKLPATHHLDHHDRIPVWVDTDKPYSRYRDHDRKYRPSPHYKRDTKRDHEERRHNQQRHERYRNR